ncbi:MAG: glutaminyl-peptide cyclotransferase [Bacteroidia bacterium]|nr:glutaminyl-peptide cyclotransferase [Bacteroidia bacterium]
MKITKIKKYSFFASFIVISVIISSCEPDKPKQNVVQPPVVDNTPEIPQIPYTIEKQYPHDVTSFTEGFLFHEGKLFESTGAPDNMPQTKSLFGIVDLKTGKIDAKAELDRTIYFGEGIVFLNGKFFQLTYKNQTGFIYDAKTFKNIGKFNYTNREGWGLTTDGKSLIMSDGTSYITYLDPTSFAVTKTLDVAENGYVVVNINELEYIKGFIYANIWMTNTIVKIDPNTGDVVGKIDISNLFNESKTKNPNSVETNGIAYDSISDKILVTGKLWPTIYEIKFPL